MLILWITLTRTFVLAPLRQSHESSPFAPSSSLPISDKHTQTAVSLSNVEVFISEFAVSSLNRSNLWGCDRVEREENRGVSRQVQGLSCRSHWDTPTLESRRQELRKPGGSTRSWRGFWELVDLPRGRQAGRGFGLCGFGSNKEIPCNPPNLLSISPPPAPRPARPARCEAPKVSEARRDLRVGALRNVCVYARACVSVHDGVCVCVYAWTRAHTLENGFCLHSSLCSGGCAQRQTPKPTPPLEET